MRIDEKQLNLWIDHFYGYGSWQAKIWFIGHEEGGGDLPEEVAEKLAYFYEKHGDVADATLCDVRELFRRVDFRIEGPRAALFSNLHDYRFDDNAVLHGTWKNLIAFAHGYRNEKLPDLLTYQRHSLALPSLQQEALIKLYPLPAHNHAWYYSWLDLSDKFNYLRSRARYQEHVYPNRIRDLLRQMKKYQPQVVMMYGMNNVNALKESVQSVFPGTKFRMVKAVKHEIPQHHLADIDGMKLLLTTQIPALRHNRIETGFDWERVGKMLRLGG